MSDERQKSLIVNDDIRRRFEFVWRGGNEPDLEEILDQVDASSLLLNTPEVQTEATK